jgi:hypothetical protein
MKEFSHLRGGENLCEENYREIGVSNVIGFVCLFDRWSVCRRERPAGAGTLLAILFEQCSVTEVIR